MLRGDTVSFVVVVVFLFRSLTNSLYILSFQSFLNPKRSSERDRYVPIFISPPCKRKIEHGQMMGPNLGKVGEFLRLAVTLILSSRLSRHLSVRTK